MRASISEYIRVVAARARTWEMAWGKIPAGERDVLKKYAAMFLKKLKDEPFPKSHKEVLRKHAKSFLKFLRGLKGKNAAAEMDLVEIELRDPDGKLPKLLSHIQGTGNIGHSFDIIVDPDDKEHTKSFGWDGDGADYIKEIRFNGEKVK